MCVRSTRAFTLKSSLTTWLTLPMPDEPKLSSPGRARASAMRAARLEHPRTRARNRWHMRFISSLHERPAADVEILGHGHVNEAARVAQRARDVAPAMHVLGEDDIVRPADEAAAVARLELEDPR